MRTPEIVAQTWAAARRESAIDIPEREVVKTVTDFEPLWDELFPGEQARIVRLLVERVEVFADGLEVRLKPKGCTASSKSFGRARWTGKPHDSAAPPSG